MTEYYHRRNISEVILLGIYISGEIFFRNILDGILLGKETPDQLCPSLRLEHGQPCDAQATLEDCVSYTGTCNCAIRFWVKIAAYFA